MSNYLTPQLKEYYYQDFLRLLEFTDSEFWDLDEDTIGSLRIINANPNINTLYSKRYSGEFGVSGTSYIQFCFSEQIEVKLNSVVKELEKEFVDFAEVYFSLQEPRENLVYSPDSNHQIGCRTNPNYFNIKHWKLKIETTVENIHGKFWEIVPTKLSQIT